LHSYRARRALHSFPTRRSSDLDAHKDQRRKSGEAYIFHPIAVAKIVASKIGLDAVSIAAALLHDVVEDTPYTLGDIERMFGETRSEEHTSELQSRENLVCRLLL